MAEDERSFIDLIIDDDVEAADRYVEIRAARVASQMIEQREAERATLDAYFDRLPELEDPASEISERTRHYAQQMLNDARFARFSRLDIAERAITLAEADLIREGKRQPMQGPQARAGGDKADVEDRPGRLSEDQRRYAERMGLDVREVERLYRARVERERNFRPGR